MRVRAPAILGRHELAARYSVWSPMSRVRVIMPALNPLPHANPGTRRPAPWSARKGGATVAENARLSQALARPALGRWATWVGCSGQTGLETAPGMAFSQMWPSFLMSRSSSRSMRSSRTVA